MAVDCRILLDKSSMFSGLFRRGSSWMERAKRLSLYVSWEMDVGVRLGLRV